MEIISSIPLVLDTGVLVDYLNNLSIPFNTWIDTYLFISSSPYLLHAHEFCRTELLYILCRKYGFTQAQQIIHDRIQSKIIFHDDPQLTDVAARIKCRFPIAFADCFGLATAQILSCVIYFQPEQEISPKIIAQLKKEFQITVHLTTDIPKI